MVPFYPHSSLCGGRNKRESGRSSCESVLWGAGTSLLPFQGLLTAKVARTGGERTVTWFGILALDCLMSLVHVAVK